MISNYLQVIKLIRIKLNDLAWKELVKGKSTEKAKSIHKKRAIKISK